MRNDIRALALADFTALGRQSEEKAVYLLQSLLLDEEACRLRIAWLREAARQARVRFPDLVPRPRPEFLGRVLEAVNDPGIITAWRQGKVAFAELETMTRAARALYEAHCRLLDREPEAWPDEEEDIMTETEVPSGLRNDPGEEKNMQQSLVTETNQRTLGDLHVTYLADTFNALLREAGFSPADVRLVRHADGRAAKGRSPYDLWHHNRPQFEWYQSTQDFDNRKKLAARYWAVFLGTPDGKTMFVGIYSVRYRGLLEQDTPAPHVDEVYKAGSCDVYDLTLRSEFSDLIGKLFIDWGPAPKVWVQYGM